MVMASGANPFPDARSSHLNRCPAYVPCTTPGQGTSDESQDRVSRVLMVRGYSAGWPGIVQGQITV